MPVSTARYRFELRLLDWAEGASRAWCATRRELFVALRDDGSVRRVYLGHPEHRWDAEQRASMARSAPRWVLYLPGDEPGLGYLEWSGLPVSVASAWLGRALGSADLADLRGGAPLDHWPEGWRVVFA